MAKLNDRERKQIIEGLVDGCSIRTLATKFHVSTTTIQRIKKDSEVTQKVTQKKEQNTQDILLHMDSKKAAVCEVIDIFIDALADPDRLAKSSLRDIATAMGILIDKFTKNSGNNDFGSIEQLIKGVVEK